MFLTLFCQQDTEVILHSVTNLASLQFSAPAQRSWLGTEGHELQLCRTGVRSGSGGAECHKMAWKTPLEAKGCKKVIMVNISLKAGSSCKTSTGVLGAYRTANHFVALLFWCLSWRAGGTAGRNGGFVNEEGVHIADQGKDPLPVAPCPPAAPLCPAHTRALPEVTTPSAGDCEKSCAGRSPAVRCPLLCCSLLRRHRSARAALSPAAQQQPGVRCPVGNCFAFSSGGWLPLF